MFVNSPKNSQVDKQIKDYELINYSHSQGNVPHDPRQEEPLPFNRRKGHEPFQVTQRDGKLVGNGYGSQSQYIKQGFPSIPDIIEYYVKQDGKNKHYRPF